MGRRTRGRLHVCQKRSCTSGSDSSSMRSSRRRKRKRRMRKMRRIVASASRGYKSAVPSGLVGPPARRLVAIPVATAFPLFEWLHFLGSLLCCPPFPGQASLRSAAPVAASLLATPVAASLLALPIAAPIATPSPLFVLFSFSFPPIICSPSIPWLAAASEPHSCDDPAHSPRGGRFRLRL